MAIGKSKRTLKGKKGRAKQVDAFAKKEWYYLKAPSMFATKDFGMTLVNKSAGTKLAIDGLRGRVFEVNLADLNNDEDANYRKIKLCCEDVQGKNCLTDFHAMDMTRDKMCRLIRKWHSLIEAHCDVRTLDGYHLRMFCVALTQKQNTQVKSTAYAQTSKIKIIRKRMVEVMHREASKSSLRELVKKLITESTQDFLIKPTCKEIFPLDNVFVRKVKVLRKPKFDITKIMELHQENAKEDVGEEAAGVVDEAAQNMLTQELAS